MVQEQQHLPAQTLEGLLVLLLACRVYHFHFVKVDRVPLVEEEVQDVVFLMFFSPIYRLCFVLFILEVATLFSCLEVLFIAFPGICLGIFKGCSSLVHADVQNALHHRGRLRSWCWRLFFSLHMTYSQSNHNIVGYPSVELR